MLRLRVADGAVQPMRHESLSSNIQTASLNYQNHWPIPVLVWESQYVQVLLYHYFAHTTSTNTCRSWTHRQRKEFFINHGNGFRSKNVAFCGKNRPPSLDFQRNYEGGQPHPGMPDRILMAVSGLAFKHAEKLNIFLSALIYRKPVLHFSGSAPDVHKSSSLGF